MTYSIYDIYQQYNCLWTFDVTWGFKLSFMLTFVNSVISIIDFRYLS